jgi:hypothetical protein
MLDIELPYTREEVLRYSDEFPQRGILCPKCGSRIPQFSELKDDDRTRIRFLILGQQPAMAMAELRAVTGCSPLWAKLWVQHSGRPEWDWGTTAPCPYCREPLRTPVAKQCRHCGMDWHDANNPSKMIAFGGKEKD